MAQDNASDKVEIVKFYHESGALLAEVPYKYGIKHGISKNYDKDNLNINCLILYKGSHELLTICLESYGAVSTKS